MNTCDVCAAPIAYSGRGRPRKFCADCSPADPYAATRAWRARNSESYNERRRARYAAEHAKVLAADAEARAERAAAWKVTAAAIARRRKARVSAV